MSRIVDEFIRQEAAASVALDGETWALPRFNVGDKVWINPIHRPAEIMGFLVKGRPCGAHPGEYRYNVNLLTTADNPLPWPYCESQLSPRD